MNYDTTFFLAMKGNTPPLAIMAKGGVFFILIVFLSTFLCHLLID